MTQEVLRPAYKGELPVALERTFTRLDRFEYSRYFRNRHHAAAIVVVALLAVLAFKLFPLQSVTLLSEGRAVQVRAPFGGQEAALAAADLSLVRGDRLLVGRVGDHAALTVQRALPVTVLADGALHELRTQVRTVAGALALAGAELRQNDRVYVDGRLATPGAQLESVSAASGVFGGEEPSLSIEVVRARPVTVVADQRRIEVRSAQPTVEGVLADAGLSVREGDLVSLPLDTEVPSGATIRLAKARTITVVVNGQAETLYTQAERVAEVLALLGVEMLESDRLSHHLDEAVAEGMEIVVVLVRELIEEHIELIPPEVIRRDDHTLAPGEERIVDGVPGQRVIRHRITYENGEEVARERVGSEIVRAPVATEHLIGPAAEDGRSPLLIAGEYTGPYKSRLRVWATWYNASHGGKERDDPSYGMTATGIPLAHGICAVDPTVIPLLTRLYVPGYGPCLAADVGGLIKGSDIDLGFSEGHAANPWHTGYVEIYILD